MHIKNAERRLFGFYGEVAQLQNRDIIRLISGKTVLDVGCGYGMLVHQIRHECKDKSVVGIDTDVNTIKIAKDFYNIDVMPMSALKMEFSEGCFDTIILRDVVHHFSRTDELRQILTEVNRVVAKELIIFDPNPNWILRLCRKIVRHEDGQMPLWRIKKALRENGFHIVSCHWRDIVAMPLSGGFVGMELVPNTRFIKSAVIKVDNILNRIFYFLKIQNLFCWRYLIYAVKHP